MLKNIVLVAIVASAAACTAQTESTTASKAGKASCEILASRDVLLTKADGSKVLLANHATVKPYDSSFELVRNVQTGDEGQLDGNKLSIGSEILNCK